MTVSIRRLVVDSLKAREISIIDLSNVICSVNGVEEVDITVTEVDVRTETIRLTIRGSNIDFGGLSKTMSEHGVTVRSIDEVNVSRSKLSGQK